MKLIEWVRFSWDFAELPELDLRLPQHYTIERATPKMKRNCVKWFRVVFVSIRYGVPRCIRRWP